MRFENATNTELIVGIVASWAILLGSIEIHAYVRCINRSTAEDLEDEDKKELTRNEELQ